jgi:hypothetical protein
MQGPTVPKAAELIGAITGVPGIDPYKETRRLLVPPVNRLLPATENFYNTIQAFAPDEGIRYFVSISMGFDWFTNKPGHMTPQKNRELLSYKNACSNVKAPFSVA